MVESHRYCLAFSTFIRSSWENLKVFTTSLRFERNGVIYSMGDPADAIYLIEAGQVKIVQLSIDGKEKIAGIYQKGDLFGEVCMCEKGKRESQAIALDPVTLTSFSVRTILALVKEDAGVALKLLMVFCARLSECQEQVASHVFDEVRERLGKELLRLSRLSVARQKEDRVELIVSLTHEDLAHLVGTTRENATEIMNEFRRRSLVEYSRGAIEVFPSRLEEYLKESYS
jgi:CRP/FNR family transcriptional regulator, cyclic AMP receptor protein